MNVPGVPNLHRVSQNVYRSAQPTAEGMKNLQAMGIKTVVNLRHFHSDRDLIGDLPMKSVNYPTLTWDPDPKNVKALLHLVEDPSQGPILIHCQHGADRTGSMCAIYRVAEQHWTPDEAMREMTSGGFGYHPVWKNLPGWTRKQMVSYHPGS